HGLCLLSHDRNGGGHAWPQQHVGVVDIQPRIVGHHPVRGDRSVGDVSDLGVERTLRERIDGETCLLADPDLANVGLIYGGLEFHLSQVGGNDEKNRRLQRGGDGLTGIDRARQHDSVYGCVDGALGEVRLLQLQVGIGDGETCFGTVKRGLGAVPRGLGGVQRLLRRHAFPCQLAGAGESLFRFLERDPGSFHAGRGGLGGSLRPLDLRLQLGGIELCQHVALSHLLVFRDRNFADDPGQFARYVDLGKWLKRSRGRDFHRQIADGSRGRGIFDTRRRAHVPLVGEQDTRKHDGDRKRGPPYPAAAFRLSRAVKPEGRLDCRSGIRFWQIDNLVQGGPLCCRTSLWVTHRTLWFEFQIKFRSCWRKGRRMQSRRYLVYDVFADRALAGNPLAVVLDCDGMDTTAMQAVAREFNLSETVFILPPLDRRHRARVRIFTPEYEMPFAGHPTVGSAVALAEMESGDRSDAIFVLEENIGAVRCAVRRDNGAIFAEFDLPQLPVEEELSADPEAFGAALGLGPHEIGFENHRVTAWSAGVPYIAVPVRDLRTAAKARLDNETWMDL